MREFTELGSKVLVGETSASHTWPSFLCIPITRPVTEEIGDNLRLSSPNRPKKNQKHNTAFFRQFFDTGVNTRSR